MFFYSGYIQWGNFLVPLKQNLLASFKSVTWDPYAYGGVPQELPWVSLLGNYNYILFFIFGGFWSMNLAVKIYILLSTFIIAYSFYLLTASFSRSQISRTIATIFFLLSPAILQQVGQGDFAPFYIYAIYFISVYILSRSYYADKQKKRYLLFLSLVLLALTVTDLQLFYLGVPMYFLFMLYFSILERNCINLKSIFIFIKDFFSSLILIALLSMPLILTSLFGTFNLSPNSSIANPLNNFIVLSAGFFHLLLMNPFSSLNISVLLGSDVVLLTNFWSIIIIFFVIVIFASGLLFRDKKMLFLEFVIILAALFGSGYASPIASVNIYLYTHMLGYQILNASYFWEWIIITPLYAILIGMLIDHLIEINSKHRTYKLDFILTIKDATLFNIFSQRHRITLKTSSKNSKIALFIVISIIIMLIAPPLIGQGFYGGGNAGIHSNTVPKSYNRLVQNLDKLIGNTSDGVAYFTPDNYVYFGNNSNGVSQPLLINSELRSPGVPSYGSPPVTSSNFFYWLYTEFYLNETHEAAQLFSIMGIKYFVTLNGVVSASSLYVANSHNSTRLMLYQKDVRLLCSNSKYSLFESKLNVNVASSVKGFSLMSSNYNSLSGASAVGLNMSKMVPVFTEDLNSSNFNFFLNNTKNMIFLNSNSFQTLAIDRYMNISNSINPLTFTNNYYFSPYQGWMSSTGLESANNYYILSDPYPFAITSTHKPISSKFITDDTGKYTMFVQVLFSHLKSKMNITVDGNVTTLNSTRVGFQWIRIPFNSKNRENTFSITSISGLSGIQRIVILKRGLVQNELRKIKEFVKLKNIPVLYLNDSGYAQIGETGIFPVRIKLSNDENKSTGVYDQLVTVPKSYFGSGSNLNMSNLQWQYSNGTVIPSWMQTYNNTSATWWLRIFNIPPFGNLNIFLTIFPKNIKVLNSYITGESSLINPHDNDGNSVFRQYNSSGLLGSGKNIFFPTNSGLYFYAKFYNPICKVATQALAGWSFDSGQDTPMFAALSNTSYSQPYYFSGHPHYFSPRIPDGKYYLFGTAMEYPRAYWSINNKVVQTTNCSSFVNSSATFVRPTGVNVSVLYSFLTYLPPNNVMPLVNIENVSNFRAISIINNESLSMKSIIVINNPNGYQVRGIRTLITVVRYSYFSGIIETSSGFRVYPIMGDLIFVLVSNSNFKVANFVNIDYNLLLYGVFVYILSLAIPIFFFILSFWRNKKLEREKEELST